MSGVARRFPRLRVGVRLFVSVVASVVASAVLSTVVSAQPARTRSLDLSLGVGGVTGGEPRAYRSSVGAAADAMFSAPVGQHVRLGVSWAVQGGVQNTDECIMRDPGTPGSQCRVALPLVSSWSVLVGREWQPSSSVAIRAFAGPSVVSVYRRTSSPYYWSSMGGVSGRLDAVLPGRANLMMSLRGAIVPAMPNASGTLALGLGVGLH